MCGNQPQFLHIYTDTRPAWPILIGVRTIGRLRAASVLKLQQGIKIPRSEVRRILLWSTLRYPFLGAWRRLFPTSGKAVASAQGLVQQKNMQIFKWFSAVCTIAFCVSFIAVRADDNSATAAVPEQPSQPTVTSAATPETNTASIAPSATPAPATPETTTPTNIVAPTPAPPAEMQPPTVKTNALAETVAPASILVTSSGAVVVQPGEYATSVTKTVSVKPGQKAKKYKKAKALQTAEAPNFVKEPGLQPIATPPLPISADKQAQLQALLAKYKADLITAGQYQTGRTKILAGP
jgi:hypothetical protein